MQPKFRPVPYLLKKLGGRPSLSGFSKLRPGIFFTSTKGKGHRFTLQDEETEKHMIINMNVLHASCMQIILAPSRTAARIMSAIRLCKASI
jgi:hypothetical protein